MSYKWKELHEQQVECKTLAEGEREELKRLHKENKELRMQKDFKKGQRLLREGNEIKFAFIKAEALQYLVYMLF